MTTPRFLQIHTLHSYPAALLNRDDSGLAKSVCPSATQYVLVSRRSVSNGTGARQKTNFLSLTSNRMRYALEILLSEKS